MLRSMAAAAAGASILVMAGFVFAAAPAAASPPASAAKAAPPPALPDPAWAVSTAPVPPDALACAAKVESAFAAMGLPATRHDAPDRGQSRVMAKHSNDPTALNAYCRRNQPVVLLIASAALSPAQLSEEKRRFKAALASATVGAPATGRIAPAAAAIDYPEGVTAGIRYHGSRAACLAEAGTALANAGFKVAGKLDERLVAGSASDGTAFALIDCLPAATSEKYPKLEMHLGVAPGVTAAARDSLATNLATMMRNSPAESGRREAALRIERMEAEREDARLHREQEAQIREAQRIVQQQADANARASYGGYGGYGMTIDENEIARRAGIAIQAARASGGGDSCSGSRCAIIMEQVAPPPQQVPGPAYTPSAPSDWNTPSGPTTSGSSCAAGHEGCVTPQ